MVDGDSRYVSQLKARYAAVKRRLYGLGGPTGVIPPTEYPEIPKPKKEKTIIQVAPEAGVLIMLDHATPSFMRLVREVADKHELDPSDIIKRGRKPNIVACRFELYYRANKELNFSFNRIGKIMKVDHTTVMNGVQRYPELQSTST
jgi:hypothetical protein